VKFHDRLIAQKVITKSLIKKYNLEEKVYFERDCMLQCVHPFIVKLHYCYQTSIALYYGMDFLPGGDLYSLIQRSNISIKDIKLYLCEIGLALTHIHSKGFVYRDLKPENILIGEDGHLQLADFGLSENIKKEGFSKTLCGTAYYIAPEMIEGISYDYSVDWWSYGILAYELICGILPYSDDNRQKLFLKIQNVDPIFPEELDAISIDFLSSFLVKDPKQRSTFDSTKHHAFWKYSNFDLVLNKKYTPTFVPLNNQRNEQNYQQYFEYVEDENIKIEKSKQIFQTLEHFSFISESY
jgi:serine/threonine protein kinase